MFYEKEADQGGYMLFKKYETYSEPQKDPIPHFHNSVEAYICTKGECLVNINGQQITLKEGDIGFVDSLTPHKSVLRSGEVYVILLSSSYINTIGWLENETLPVITKDCRGFEKIREFVEWSYPFMVEMNDQMRQGFACMLLGLLKKYCGTIPRAGDRSSKIIIEIMRYIGEHYREPITLEMLAKKYGYEKTYLSRLFNKMLGMNFREYLNRCRMDAVNKMHEENPDMPIYKIFTVCGFESPNTYYRAAGRYDT